MAECPSDEVAGGDGFEAFYRSQYAPAVRLLVGMTVRPALAEEIAQESLLVAHRRWESVSTMDRPDLWLRRVAVNRAISTRRRLVAEVAALGRVRAQQVEPPRWDGADARLDVKPERLGQEKVRSVTTTRYRLVISGEAAQRLWEAGQEEVADDGMPELDVSAEETIYELWVDEDERVRRLVKETQLTVTDARRQGSGANLLSRTTRTTTEWFDFGAEVPPFAPPPDDEVTFFESGADFRQAQQEAFEQAPPKFQAGTGRVRKDDRR